MVTLSKFTFRWTALNKALNTIVDAVNRNSPLPGDNIHLDEKGQSGVSINAVRDSKSDQSQDSQASQALPPMVLKDVGLVDVTVVDPATCVQSTLTVLAQVPGSSIPITVVQ